MSSVPSPTGGLGEGETHSKPSRVAAKAYAKQLVWQHGSASIMNTSIKQMAGLGIGFQLYFTLLDNLVILFFLLTLLSLPAMFANLSGSNMTAVDVDSFSFALLTLGNQGTFCESGSDSGPTKTSMFGQCEDIACDDDTKRCILGSTWSTSNLAYLLCAMSTVSALSILYYVDIKLVRLINKYRRARDLTAPSVTRYAVLVKGLPADVKEEEVAEMFSSNYNLSMRQPYHPLGGLSQEGCQKLSFRATFIIVFISCIVYYAQTSHNFMADILDEAGFGYFSGFSKFLLNVFLFLSSSFCSGYAAMKIVEYRKSGALISRHTPQEIYEDTLEVKNDPAMKRKPSVFTKSDKRKVYAAPSTLLTDDDPNSLSGPVCEWEEYWDEHHECYYYYNATTGVSEWQKPVGFWYNAGSDPNDNPDASKKKVQKLQVSLPVKKRKPRSTDDPELFNPLDTPYASKNVGKWVTEVTLIQNSGRVIRSFREKKSLLAKIDRQQLKTRDLINQANNEKAKQESPEVQEKQKNDPLSMATSKLNDIERKKNIAIMQLDQLKKRLNDLQWSISNGSNPKAIKESCGVFVTFEHEESKNRCLDDYRSSKSSIFRHLQHDRLKFHRKNNLTGGTDAYPILAVRAPEPGEIMWENLEFPHRSKKLQRAKSNMITVALLLSSFVIIFLAYQQQAVFENTLLDFSFCTDDLPSIFWGTYEDVPTDLILERDRTKDNGAKNGCPANEFYIAFSNATIKKLENSSSLPPIFNPANATHPYTSRDDFDATSSTPLCDTFCHPSSSTASCPVLPTGLPSSYTCENGFTKDSQNEPHSCSAYRKSDPAACYCYQRMLTELASSSISLATFSRLRDEEGDICSTIFLDYVLAKGTALAATGVIVIVNFALKEIIPRMSASEHHSSSSGEAKGTFIKVSTAQIVNTAFSTILANARIDNHFLANVIPNYNHEIESEKHDDFTKDWYATVGVSLTLTMFVNALTPHLAKLFSLMIGPPIAWFKSKSMTSQSDFNELYKGKPFRIETRFAFIVTTVFVSLLFCGGLPILLPFACFALLLCRWIDRYTLLKDCPQPPAYDERLAKAFRVFMKVSFFLYIFVTCYMYGSPDFLATESIDPAIGGRRRLAQEGTIFYTVYQRMMQVHVFPVFFVGSLSLLKTVVPFIFPFLSPDNLRAVAKLMRGQDPPSRYYAPGYSSTFHSLLTEEQAACVAATGNISESDEKLGYRLNKKSKNIVNRVNEHGELLLTWEVAELDGLLHTYDMAKNDRYKNEFNFLQAFLQNFASLDKNDEENPEVNYNDGYNAAYNDLYYQHEDEMNRLRLNMVKKVQVADEENQMLVSKVAASKWAQNIKLKKEANKRVKVLEDIKSEKVRRVGDMFKFNMVLNRVKKVAAQREEELAKLHCAGVLDRLVEEVAAMSGVKEGGAKNTRVLEKMLSTRSQDVKQYKEMYEKSLMKAVVSAEIGKLKINAIKKSFAGDQIVKDMVANIVFEVVERRTVEEIRRKEAEYAVGLVLERMIGDVTARGHTPAVEALQGRGEEEEGGKDEVVLEDGALALEQCRNILLQIVMNVVETSVVQDSPTIQPKHTTFVLPPSIATFNEAQVIESCNDALESMVQKIEQESEQPPLMFRPPYDDRPDVATSLVMEQILTKVERNVLRDKFNHLRNCLVFENEIKKQRRAERRRKKEKQALSALKPDAFFRSLSVQQGEWMSKTQDELELTEVRYCVYDIVRDVVQIHETEALKQALNEVAISSPNTVAPFNSRSNSLSDDEENAQLASLEKENKSLAAARAKVMEELARKGLEKSAATRIQTCWRKRAGTVVTIQRAVRSWLLRRGVSASAMNVGLKAKLVTSAKKENKLREELEEAKAVDKKKLDFEGILRAATECEDEVKAVKEVGELKEKLQEALKAEFEQKTAKTELDEKLRKTFKLLDEERKQREDIMLRKEEERARLNAEINKSSELQKKLEEATKELEERERKLKEEEKKWILLEKERAVKPVLEGLLAKEDEKDEFEREMQELRADFEAKLQNLEGELKGLEEEKAEADGKVEDIKRRAQTMEESAKEGLEEHQKEVEELRKAKETTEVKLKQVAQDMEGTKARLGETEKAMAEAEKKTESVEQENTGVKARLDEALDILQGKETSLLEKIRQINEANVQLIEAQRVSSERATILKEEERMLKESITEAAEFKSKLMLAEENSSALKRRSEELERKVDQMKVSSDLKGTFDELTSQLQAASIERETAVQLRIREDERVRARLEEELLAQRIELEEQRKKQLEEIEDARKRDVAAMEEKVSKLTDIVSRLEKGQSTPSEKGNFVEDSSEGEGEVWSAEEYQELRWASAKAEKEVREKERNIQELEARLEENRGIAEKHGEMQNQLKKALKKIISMKQKQNQEKEFFKHKLKEQKLEEEEVEGRLDGAEAQIMSLEAELERTQHVVLTMEEEKEKEETKFSRVMMQLREGHREKESGKHMIEKLKGAIGTLTKCQQEERDKTERMGRKMKELAKRGGNLVEKLEEKDFELEKVKGELRKEQMARKLAYNQLQDMQGKIRVFARCRPLVSGEIEKGAKGVVKVLDEATLQLMDGKGKRAKEFTFDGVLGPRASQEHVFGKVQGLVGSVVDGYNVTIFAYGQTGSGKTYTMAGGGNDDDIGIIPRAIKELFAKLNAKSEQYEVKVKCYFVELYVNKLIDLLAGGQKGKEGEKLEVKLDAKRMVYVKNARVVEVDEEEDLINLWAEGEELRNVSSTNMNTRSSRSHSVLSIVVETRSRATGATTTAKMSLIDLAGSERVKKSGVVGEGFKEALSINKSLTVLSDVISALSNESKFIPYRNNKLTQLMQDSLGGNSKTLMIVGISPASTEMEESLMSLHYATRARLIQNKSVKGKGVAGGGGDATVAEIETRRMEEIIERLQTENGALEKRLLNAGEGKEKEQTTTPA